MTDPGPLSGQRALSVKAVICYDQPREEYRYQLIDWTIEAPHESRSAPLLARPKDRIESLVDQLNQVARQEVGCR